MHKNFAHKSSSTSYEDTFFIVKLTDFSTKIVIHVYVHCESTVSDMYRVRQLIQSAHISLNIETKAI